MAASTLKKLGTSIVDRENLLGGKTATKNGAPVTRRNALGDLGNKLNNHTISQKPDTTFKDGLMKPPKATLIPRRKPSVKPTDVSASKSSEAKDKPPERSFVNKNAKEKTKLEISLNDKPSAIGSTAFKDSTISYSEHQLNVVDPDASCKHDAQMVTEYLPNIFTYLRQLETEMPVKKDYLNTHESTPKMRSVLLNWLVDVHTSFSLCLETLHLCIGIVDRYLQLDKKVGRPTLQLVGVTALFIACKYEELYVPSLNDFVYVCDNSYSSKQILKMEVQILKKLNFMLGRPLSIHFLRRYSKIAAVGVEEHNLSKYLLELALLDYSMVDVKPSIVAAAACCLSISILKNKRDPSMVWNTTLEYYTTYKYQDFHNVVLHLAYLITTAVTSRNRVSKKYSSSVNGKISLNFMLSGPLVTKLATEFLALHK